MQIPVEITFRNMDRSEVLEARVLEEAARLDRFFDRIMSCRVIVEAPHRHHGHGNLYHVAIHLTVPPAHTLDITHAGRKDPAHRDPYVAVRDAFRAAVRQLEDHARVHRGKIKTHAMPLYGTVRRLLPDGAAGFIETSEGAEIYFHRNSVVGDKFEALRPGSAVRLVVAESESAKGPQASTVVLLGKHHLVG